MEIHAQCVCTEDDYMRCYQSRYKGALSSRASRVIFGVLAVFLVLILIFMFSAGTFPLLMTILVVLYLGMLSWMLWRQKKGIGRSVLKRLPCYSFFPIQVTLAETMLTVEFNRDESGVEQGFFCYSYDEVLKVTEDACMLYFTFKDGAVVLLKKEGILDASMEDTRFFLQSRIGGERYMQQPSKNNDLKRMGSS